MVKVNFNGGLITRATANTWGCTQRRGAAAASLLWGPHLEHQGERVEQHKEHPASQVPSTQGCCTKPSTTQNRNRLCFTHGMIITLLPMVFF